MAEKIIHNSLIYARKLQQRSRSKLSLHPKTAKTFEGEITKNMKPFKNINVRIKDSAKFEIVKKAIFFKQ